MVSQPVPVPTRDPELVREALDALFDIAWAQDSPDLARAIQLELDGLTPEAREDLLEGMIDTEVLAQLLGQAKEGAVRTPLEPLDGPLDEEQTELVNAALRPLASLAIGPDAEGPVGSLDPEERARILFAAVNRFSGLP